MKTSKKVYVILGLINLPIVIITWLIIDLIYGRDLLEGFFFSLFIGLVLAIFWMVVAAVRGGKKENQNHS